MLQSKFVVYESTFDACTLVHSEAHLEETVLDEGIDLANIYVYTLGEPVQLELKVEFPLSKKPKLQKKKKKAIEDMTRAELLAQVQRYRLKLYTRNMDTKTLRTHLIEYRDRNKEKK
jgi:hypothetical protein